jgi:hypothetical protein
LAFAVENGEAGRMESEKFCVCRGCEEEQRRDEDLHSWIGYREKSARYTSTCYHARGNYDMILNTWPKVTRLHLNAPAMADVGTKKQDEKEKEKKEESKTPPPPPPTPLAEIKSNVALIDRAVSTLEPRFTHRVLRSLTALRKRTDETVLRNAVEDIYPKGKFWVQLQWK